MRSSLTMRGTSNETRIQYTHLTFRSTSSSSCADVVVLQSHLISPFEQMRMARECRHHRWSSDPPCCGVDGLCALCPPPPGPIQGSDMIDWMITLPLTSIRISPARNQRLISFIHASHPCFAALLTNPVYPPSRCAER